MKVNLYNSDFVFINTRHLNEIFEHEVPNATEAERDRLFAQATHELQKVGRYWLSARYYLTPAK